MSNGTGHIPEQHPRTAPPHRISQTALQVLTALLAALLVALGTAHAAEAAPGDDLLKVFVVQDPAQSGGQLATLQSIAAATLGDAARADEILELNRGLAQKDESALESATDQLHPGWILRLPKDASGPGVQLAKDTRGQGSSSAPPATGTSASPGSGDGDSTMLTVPLAAAVALLGAVLLALITVGIMSRRQMRAGFAAVRRGVHRLGEPARRRRRLAQRQVMTRWFDADIDLVRRAYDALDEFAATDTNPEPPVHALSVDDAGVTVWLPASDAAGAPWANLDATRWRRTATMPPGRPAPSDGMTSRSFLSACLVRAGTEADGRPVFIDLSRLDGVLSVTGDKAVSRDTVQNLLAEISRTRPGTPVIVLQGSADALPVFVPPGLQQAPQVAPRAVAAPVPARGTVRGATVRRPLKGLVVVAGTPTAQEASELATRCGAGWTGLVYGEAQDSHWRWYTDGEGRLDIPVLDLKLTVPA